MPGYVSRLVESQSDGTAVANSTAEASLLPAVAKVLLPSGYLNRVGKGLSVAAHGRISNIVTTPGTLTLRFKLGPTSNIAVAVSTAVPLNATAKTNVAWWLDLDLMVRAIGAGTAAQLFAQGTFSSESVSGAAAGLQASVAFQAAAPAVGTGFDSSVANQIDLTAQFSVANAGNSIQCHGFALDDRTTTP